MKNFSFFWLDSCAISWIAWLLALVVGDGIRWRWDFVKGGVGVVVGGAGEVGHSHGAAACCAAVGRTDCCELCS